MANDQKDPRFDENRPGQEKKQDAQNPDMKKDDLNRPADANRGLNPQGQQQQPQRDPYSERSHSSSMNKDLDPSRQATNEPYARERSTSPEAQGEPRREEQRKQDEDKDLTEIPKREEERQTKTPSGEKPGLDPSSKTDDLTKSQQNKPEQKGGSTWKSE